MSSKNFCPSLYTAIRTTYWSPSGIFVDKSVIKSQKGIAHGGPIAMPMYGVTLLLLTDMVE